MFEVPKEISQVTETLKKNGFEAYLVGGCVRDMLVNKKPKDWDVTTNATPEDIVAAFPHTFYENDYGTVGVVTESSDETIKMVEVTPFRIEGKYSDKRRPDTVSFAQRLEDDLMRRDFTVNAMAYDVKDKKLIDLYGGADDLKRQTVRAVGDARERFAEDALRLVRAVRLATEMGFSIEPITGEAIEEYAEHITHIAIERVREEFSRIIMSQNSLRGITLLHGHGLLQYIVPELEEGLGVEQNGDHIYDVWEHTMRAVQHSSDRGWPIHVRLSALFHDVGKPRTRQWSKEKNDWTFYGHDVVGAKMAKAVLTRMRYPNDMVETVEKLVRWHLFFSDIEKITLSAVRRLVRNVGAERVWDLMKVRACDRIGMGRPKEKPYRLRKYESMIEEATRSPVSVGMLAIDGARIIEITDEKPSPRIGFILHALLEDVLDDPARNTKDYLEKKAKGLAALPADELLKIGEEGKRKKEEEEGKEVAEIRKRYGVK